MIYSVTYDNLLMSDNIEADAYAIEGNKVYFTNATYTTSDECLASITFPFDIDVSKLEVSGVN